MQLKADSDDNVVEQEFFEVPSAALGCDRIASKGADDDGKHISVRDHDQEDWEEEEEIMILDATTLQDDLLEHARVLIPIWVKGLSTASSGGCWTRLLTQVRWACTSAGWSP